MLLKSSVQLPSCAGASLSPAVNVSSPDGNRVSSLHSSIAASVIAPLALPSPLQGFSNISSFRFAGAVVLNLSCEASSPTCSRLAGQHLSHARTALDPPAPRQPCRFSSPALLVCLVKKRRRSSRRRCHSSSPQLLLHHLPLLGSLGPERLSAWGPDSRSRPWCRSCRHLPTPLSRCLPDPPDITWRRRLHLDAPRAGGAQTSRPKACRIFAALKLEAQQDSPSHV